MTSVGGSELSTWTGNNAGRSPHFAGFHLTFTHQHIYTGNEEPERGGYPLGQKCYAEIDIFLNKK